MTASTFRTDRNRNPAAFTVDLAKQGGLILNNDYVVGDPFPDNPRIFTAKLLGDPVDITIRLIDVVGYYTKARGPRWSYIAMPRFIWSSLARDEKRDVVGFHYQMEGGTAMRGLFPNYGKS